MLPSLGPWRPAEVLVQEMRFVSLFGLRPESRQGASMLSLSRKTLLV